MAVIVKRNRVRYNGKVYGPGQQAGQVITGLSKKEEARLIAGSNGSIEKYVPPKIVEEPEKPDGDNKDSKTEETGDSGSESASQPDDTTGEDDDPDAGDDLGNENIVAVDPGELIKPGGKETKKRGR